jgi:hypothetical protein
MLVLWCFSTFLEVVKNGHVQPGQLCNPKCRQIEADAPRMTPAFEPGGATHGRYCK